MFRPAWYFGGSYTAVIPPNLGIQNMQPTSFIAGGLGWQALAAAVCGGCAAAAFEPVGCWPAMLVGMAGWMMLLDGKSVSHARNLGLCYGAVFALGTMHWFFNLFGMLAISLMALMALYHWLLGGMIGMLGPLPPVKKAALAALFAVGVEWLRGDAWYLRFPWYTPPHALAAQPEWIAAARWLGVYGLSGLIWFTIACGAWQTTWCRRSCVWSSLALLPAASLMLPAVDAPQRVALLVQGEGTFDVERVIARLPTQKADVAITPEFSYSKDYSLALESASGPRLLMQKTQALTVFGAMRMLAKKRFENVAVVLAPGQHDPLGWYVKHRPVPLFLDGLPGTLTPVFPFPDGQGTLGVGICYDFDAPAVAAELVANGATVLAAPTGDMVHWGELQHQHHGQLARLRAVECDRWLLRAVSSGRTEVINPAGHPSQAGLPFPTPGSLLLPFDHLTTRPPGIRLHWLGPASFATSFTLLLLMAIYSKRRGNRFKS